MAQKEGFSSFLAFPDQNEVYRGNDLFPLFANRLMPRSRPDFSTYVQRLDLDPEDVDDFEILARSGGRRMTDSFELFPLPLVREDGCYVTHFLAHGIRYLNEVSHKRISELSPGEKLLMVADFQNPYDPSALPLRTEDRIFVGYIPRYLLPDAWKLQETCEYIDIFIEQVNQPPAPIQQRLLCRMESCWPTGFKPYCTDEFRPLAEGAKRLECPE